MFFDFGIRWKKGKPQHTFQVNYYKSLAPWLREKNPQNDISCVVFELKKKIYTFQFRLHGKLDKFSYAVSMTKETRKYSLFSLYI